MRYLVPPAAAVAAFGMAFLIGQALVILCGFDVYATYLLFLFIIQPLAAISAFAIGVVWIKRRRRGQTAAPAEKELGSSRAWPLAPKE